MRHLWICTFVFLAYVLAAQPQTDTAIVLPEAIVEGDRFSLLPVGTRQDTMSLHRASVQSTASLDDLLESEGLFFVKKYGVAGLASLSVRGTAATQSAILWNGMNLQSPMNGQKDLQLIPAFFLEKASVSYGSGSALAGSGAVGATVEMNTSPGQMDGWQTSLQAAMGAFGLSTYGVSVGYGNRKFNSVTKAYHHAADNDYDFVNTTRFNNPKETLPHARVERYGFQHHNAFFTKAGSFEVNLMHLSADRLLPPTIFEQQSQKAQQDETTYANAGWQYHTDKHGFNVDIGWIRESIDYQDTVSDIFSTNLANSFIFQPEYSLTIGKKHLLKVAGYHRTDLAELDVVEDEVNRSESALIASLALVAGQDWLINANLRQGYSLGRFQPLIPSVSTSYAFSDQFSAKFQVARHYREPTLNALYWEPGGNPDLQPEDGVAVDGTLTFREENENSQLQFELTGYYNYMQDQIVWQPNGNFWTPFNVNEVYSRGVEGRLQWGYDFGEWQVGLQAGGSYTRASQDAFTRNEQLIQVPMWKSTNQVHVQWRQFQLRYRHMITSKRFTNTSNTRSLPGYDVARLELSGRKQWKQLGVEAFVRVENLWDQNYRIVAAQFMPPRHFKTGIQIQFQ